MHPRATNFNPEADVDEGCTYYQLSLEMQHYAPSLRPDTLIKGNWLYDANNEPFYLNAFQILGGEVHLVKAGTDEVFQSPETVSFYDFNGFPIQTEDNFFISHLEKYDYEIAGWTELGNFDRLHFHLGIPNEIRQTNPAEVTESGHPLSTTATTYMFDSSSMSYRTCHIEVVQPNTSKNISLDLFDYIPIELPYAIEVKDGENIPIRLKLNYQTLFNGISFSNDNILTIKNKLVQNFPAAYSTY